MISRFSFLLCMSVAFAAQFPAHTNYGIQRGYQGGFQGGYQGGYQGGFQKNVIPIVSQDFQIAPDGSSYQFNYASADGTQRQESGHQTGPESYSVQGSFSYSLPDGAPVQVQFVSDEYGYQPSGAGVHPDIAKAVAEQVAEARSNPHSGGSDGSYGGGSSFGGSSFGGSSYGGYRGSSSFGGHRPVYG